MNIISVCGRKGGIAKTTSAANVAAALAMGGANVLAVDADSQGHLAQALGVARVPLFSRWAAGGALLSLPVPLRASASSSGAPAVSGCLALVAGDNGSLGLALDGDAVAGLADRLRLEAARLGADFVIVDSPAVGALQDFALLAADVCLVPAPCHYLGASGAVDTAALARRIAPAAQVVALPTMYDRRERDARHWLAELGAAFSMLLPAIPHRVAVAESLAVGVPLVAYKPRNDAAAAYCEAAALLARGVA